MPYPDSFGFIVLFSWFPLLHLCDISPARSVGLKRNILVFNLLYKAGDVVARGPYAHGLTLVSISRQ